MNQKNSDPGSVSVPELVLAAIGVTLFVVPIFMLKVHPGTAWVQDYLSGGRVLVVWLVGFAALYSIEKLIRKRQGRDTSFIKLEEDE